MVLIILKREVSKMRYIKDRIKQELAVNTRGLVKALYVEDIDKSLDTEEGLINGILTHLYYLCPSNINSNMFGEVDIVQWLHNIKGIRLTTEVERETNNYIVDIEEVLRDLDTVDLDNIPTDIEGLDDEYYLRKYLVLGNISECLIRLLDTK